jgi:citrate lyase beta subunit
VAEARELVAAFEEHARRGSGAFAWNGQMVDMPHLTRAKRLLERGRQAGGG